MKFTKHSKDQNQLPPENIWGHRKKLKYLLNAIETYKERIGRPLKILDFGCGNGSAVTSYISKIPNVIVYGVDLHKPSIEYAKKNIQQKPACFLLIYLITWFLM